MSGMEVAQEWLSYRLAPRPVSSTEPTKLDTVLLSAQDRAPESESFRLVSIVIPVRDEEKSIGFTVRQVLAQAVGAVRVEVIVVDDGSSDGTASTARDAGAVVVRTGTPGVPGNPAAARNLGVKNSKGDPLVFLDADCTPGPEWLEAILDAHAEGHVMVGGSLDMPTDLSWTARCDYYCGWYHVHSGRKAGMVPNHPPGNLSVRREAFLSTEGFVERQPIAFAHEELAWQAELQSRGHGIRFVPEAVVSHHNRPGFGNLLRRNYRWAYSSIESKSETRAARMAWLYGYPAVLVTLSLPLGVAQAAYIVGCWLRAGRVEPLLMLPAILSARLAYGAGMATGGLRWIRERGRPPSDRRPRWE